MRIFRKASATPAYTRRDSCCGAQPKSMLASFLWVLIPIRVNPTNPKSQSLSNNVGLECGGRTRILLPVAAVFLVITQVTARNPSCDCDKQGDDEDEGTQTSHWQ